MSALELMRPAARSAAVRPHSSSLASRSAGLPAPGPVSAASRCSASLFFVPAPRPVGKQSYWRAGHCSHFDWEHGRGWEQFREQCFRCLSTTCATVPTVPSFRASRVICTRASACAFFMLPLGTWEQCSIAFEYQSLTLFPSLFPALRRVGTWEQSEGSACRRECPSAASNKIEAGYRLLQRASGDARRKFRASIAPVQARLVLELGRIRGLATWSQQNGGNPPFLTAERGHVGMVMLEGSRQAADIAAQSAACPKLGRLRDHPAGELTLRLAIEAPGAPNRAPSSPAMSPLHGGGIWIETRSGSIDAVQGGSSHDGGMPTVCENAQTGDRRRGPGGARFSIGFEFAGRRHNRRAGKRAGVSRFPASSRRPHEAGGSDETVRDFRGRQGPFELSANQTAKGIANG